MKGRQQLGINGEKFLAQPIPDAPQLTTLEDQLRECFGRVIYSHSTHRKQSDLCASTQQHYTIAKIFLAAVTTSGALGVVVFDDFWLKVATAVFALLNLFVSSYLKDLDPAGLAQKHRDTAVELWSIRESYLSLLTDLSAGAIDHETAIERRDQLQHNLAIIYKTAPITSSKAYKLAQIGLQRKEDYTFNNGEIDRFLTPALKREYFGDVSN
jgi:hypothetical protein